MLMLGLFLGILAYVIFFLGIVGSISKFAIFFAFLAFFLLVIFLFKRGSLSLKKFSSKKEKLDRLTICIFALLFLQGVVNFVGVLGPEISFDALWYHLTLPKLYTRFDSLVFIPGGLFYYSTMPKLVEMLYIPALLFSNEILAKGIHFLFGVVTAISLYTLARKFMSINLSLLCVLIFYTNLVVGWESITAYTDLARAFFVTLSLSTFVLWLKKKQPFFLILTGVFVGLDITTKLLGVITLVGFFLVLTTMVFTNKLTPKAFIKNCSILFLLAFFVPLPWLLFSFIHTGNPLYPFFSPLYGVAPQQGIISPIIFFRDFWELFVKGADPLHPLYIITIPLLVYFFRRFPKEIGYLVLFSLATIVCWYILPRTGGGRYVVSFLPLFSLLVGVVLLQLQQKHRGIYKGILGIAIVYGIFSLWYRGVANAKFLPVIFGMESKNAFLEKNLVFSFGDYYDIDGAMKKLTKGEPVLLVGFHNLYYMDIPFVHESYAKDTATINYIATQHADLPEEYSNGEKIYRNEKTGVTLYKRQ